MNSDIIKARFGSYGVEVLSQNRTNRVANLYSGSGDDAVCRTLAVTEFVVPTAESLTESHEIILSGGSIGATLRAAGFDINKKLITTTQTPAGAAFVELANGSVVAGTPLLTHVYGLFAQDNETEIPYAVIAEAYHPAHTPPVPAESLNNPELQSAADRALRSLNSFVTQRSISRPAA